MTAFEQRTEGKELMERNSRKFGTPGITTVMGDFLETELGGLPAPRCRIYRWSWRKNDRDSTKNQRSAVA